ncbi:hypothetical protein P3X46_006643 [Hevea brasiliensis]|uniref:Uncharacterized protein n=1 Tax=Hevea brasiliensis TaxID=3981 RepID=A0ABQ9MQV9_HEVBR|nr:hypothetical protein P3X46_006643 [Hevea brasiliensis]
MHDFCFTIPYGLILVVGGLVGYVKKGSVASLGGGVGTGLVLVLAVCAAALMFIMGQRYVQTSKIMPAAIIAGISALMTGFYVYKIATGGNHIPAKAE